MNVTSQQTIPLSIAEGGAIRVSGTRVSLDSIVYAFRNGASAESIAESYPTVTLADVYTVIGYYLSHRGEVDEYLSHRESEASKLEAEVKTSQDAIDWRERLLARHGQQ